MSETVSTVSLSPAVAASLVSVAALLAGQTMTAPVMTAGITSGQGGQAGGSAATTLNQAQAGTGGERHIRATVTGFRHSDTRRDDMSDTAGMWANMLGLGPLLGAINDPNFQQQIKTVVTAITQTHEAALRVETKLDLLLAEKEDGRRIASVPANHGSIGTGTNSVTGGVADDGGGQSAGMADPAYAVRKLRLS